MLFEHWRDGSLIKEASIASSQSKYNTTDFNGVYQPRQDIMYQYQIYQQYGYNDEYWKNIQPHRPQYGVWVTCFVGFNMKHSKILDFLATWHYHILLLSTQDQISFSFVLQQMNLHPYSFPDDNIEGNSMRNTLYYKVLHGE